MVTGASFGPIAGDWPISIFGGGGAAVSAASLS
jgi:hypothetical protein